MRIAAALVVSALLAMGARVGAQHVVRMSGPAGVASARILRAALASPHALMVADSGHRIELPRNAELPNTVVILAREAAVSASVRGDVVVVGGDLFLRPGATVEGHAIAIGGAVYRSTLAIAREGTVSLRDESYRAVHTADGLLLTYEYIGAREPRLELPLLDELRIPTYDRVNGANIPWGPVLRPTIRIEVEPFVTYRSHLGEWDPSVRAFARLSGPRLLTIEAGRFTRTNDAWIHSDLLNSVNTLVAGSDPRNYYRADRAQMTIGRVDQYTYFEVERYAGASTERAWSVGALDTVGARPWTVTGRADPQGIARPNPPIDRGRISSALVGARVRGQLQDARIGGTAQLEIPWRAPNDARFAQLTLDATVQFPTFAVQRFRSDLHLVVTAGDSAPRQRYAYLGGPGTLPVLQPLSLGGDQLLLLDSRYEVPIPSVRLPFAGSPTVALRHRIGSAGPRDLPRLVQNVGVRLTLSFFMAEFSLDPATRQTDVSVGLSFAR